MPAPRRLTGLLRPALVPLGLAGLVLATRLPRLGRPRAMVFDEVYYAQDAADLLRHGVEAAAAHPPLGKWLIAGGIRLAGFDAAGWRLAPLLAGVALVLVTWWTARVVTGDDRLAAVAGVLVTFDGIAFVTGRLALLDVFVALATTAAAGCLLAALRDRDDPDRLRRWRWATAVLLGVGTAVKWGAVWTWPVAAILLVALERRAAPPAVRWRRTAAAMAVLLLVPAAVYVAAYGPWFAQAERTRTALAHCEGEVPCRLGVVERAGVWLDHQLDLVEFHTDLEPENDEAQPAWTWLTMAEPSNLFDKPCLPAMARAPQDLDDGVCTDGEDPTHARLLALANPVSWFAGLASLAVLGVLAIARRDDAAAVVLALVVTQWLPWILSGRDVYSYYAVALVPLLAVATVLALHRLPRVRRWAVWPLVIGSVAAFWFLYPLLTATALGDGAADLRLLLSGWS